MYDCETGILTEAFIEKLGMLIEFHVFNAWLLVSNDKWFLFLHKKYYETFIRTFNTAFVVDMFYKQFDKRWKFAILILQEKRIF